MPEAPHILVIDDEEGLRFTLSTLLKKKGFRVTTAENGRVGLDAVKSLRPDFVLCDLRMPEVDGMEFLRRATSGGFDRPIVMMSAYGTVDQAVEAMRMGAFDYVGKPFKQDEILVVLDRAAERERLRHENVQLREAALAAEDREILTDDPRMRELLAMVRKIAGFKTTVLITGESGTGKELFARSLHRHSPRATAPFVAINCGAIPEHLLESELFGHAKGAFTDAREKKIGLITSAAGGTLFLDEVAELPLLLQVKLLRVLQDGRVRPVGANEEIEIDVRIVAATAQDIEARVRSGEFREDLYYRLNVFHLEVPPLRDRRGDILLLARHTVRRLAQLHGLPVSDLTADAARAIEEYPWPGNVRELENALERALVLSGGREIRPDDLPERVRIGRAVAMPFEGGDLSVKSNTRRLERQLIAKALETTGGNKSRAAKLLDLSLRALLYKIKDYGLEGAGRPGADAGDDQLS